MENPNEAKITPPGSENYSQANIPVTEAKSRISLFEKVKNLLHLNKKDKAAAEPVAPAPSPRDVMKQEADLTRQKLNASKVQYAIGKEAGVASTDGPTIAQLEGKESEFAAAGVTSTIAPVESSAIFNTPPASPIIFGQHEVASATADSTEKLIKEVNSLANVDANLEATVSTPPQTIPPIPPSAETLDKAA